MSGHTHTKSPSERACVNKTSNAFDVAIASVVNRPGCEDKKIAYTVELLFGRSRTVRGPARIAGSSGVFSAGALASITTSACSDDARSACAGNQVTIR